MTDDWPTRKARLEARCAHHELYEGTLIDIRAALQRVGEQSAEIEHLKDRIENLLHRMTSEEAATEIEALRQRVEALSEIRKLKDNQIAALENNCSALRQRVEELEGEARVLIDCPCWCHAGDGPEPHADCRECVRGTSTPGAIDRDHTEALWREKWTAALDLMGSRAEAAEAAEATLAVCEQDRLDAHAAKEAAEAKLALVVGVLEQCQCNTGECPCIGMALDAAKEE